MSYHWVEHTGELELELEAPSVEGVLAEALHAFAQLLHEDGDGPRLSREIALQGNDREVLLVDWLDELVYLAETEDLVPEAVEAIRCSPDSLHATVRCRRGRPRHLVKAATYTGWPSTAEVMGSVRPWCSTSEPGGV